MAAALAREPGETREAPRVVARQKIARQGTGRSRWECVKYNLASAGVAAWTITIIGAVCGAVGAVLTSPSGPGAAGGAVTAAAVCLAGVAGLSVGFVTGIIIGCMKDPSFENITVPQASAAPEGEGETAVV
jgi:hypothetical protein